MTFNDLRRRARALFTPGTVERELDDELAFHVESETRKSMTCLAAAFVPARRAARIDPIAALRAE